MDISCAYVRNAKKVFDQECIWDKYIKEYRIIVEIARKSPKKAISDMEALAFQGSIMAMLYVADAMRAGWIYEKVYIDRAREWYSIAASSGSPRAECELSLIEMNAGNRNKAIYILRSSIDKGYVPALNALAIMKYKENNTPEDRIEAICIWNIASKMGHIPSTKNLLVHYTKSIKNHVLSISYLRTRFRLLFLDVVSPRYSDRRR